MEDKGAHGELARLKDKLRFLLKQNKPTKAGKEGSYNVRFHIQKHGRDFKARRVEIGLGTANREKALHAAAVLVRVLEGMGMHITSKLPTLDNR